MDPFSITASSVGLATAALKATKSITDFVVAVRSAKADLTGVKGELIALQDVLEGVQQSCSTVETGITSVSCERIEKLMQNCHGVIDKIEALLQRHQSSRLGPAIKWTLTGKEDARKLRDELEAHRDALAIALDLAHLEISQSISTDTGTLVVDAAVIRVNTEQIMDKLEYLQDRILRSHAGGATLERYLDEMTECAASVAGDVRKATKVRMSRASDVEVLSTLEQTVPGSDDEASVDNVEEPVQEQSWFDRMRSYQEALESQNARAAQDQASMRLLFMVCECHLPNEGSQLTHCRPSDPWFLPFCYSFSQRK